MSVIDAFNGIQQYPLLEKFGIINLDDAKYLLDIKDITKLFLDVVYHKSNDYEEVYIDWFGYPRDGKYKLITIKNKCNIDTVLLLIHNIDLPNTVINKNIIKELLWNALLSNDAAINHGYYEYKKIKEKDNLGHISTKYHITKCTIVLVYYLPWITVYNYKEIIEHELKHIFDLYTLYKCDNNLMNKDIMTKDTTLYSYIVYNVKAGNLNQLSIDYDTLVTMNNDDIPEYFENDALILPLMSDLLYYMNKSEISARLVQFRYSNDLSESKNLYKEYDKLCDRIINAAPDDIKQLINHIIITCDYSNIYNIKFENKDTAYISNTNKLFKFYKKRINHFIKMCDKLSTEKHLREYKDPLAGLGMINKLPLWIRNL